MLLLGLAVCAASRTATAHTTPVDSRARAERAHACDRDAEAAEAFDPTGLGTTLTALQERFGDTLTPQTLERPKSALERRMEKQAQAEPSHAPTFETAPPPAHDPYANQARFRRSVGAQDVRFAEYDLYDGRVYRIRWRLVERFDLPVMDDLVTQATACYGKPVYDQEPEWKLSDGKALLRRTGWERGGRLLELRQLHPLNGGPVYVTVTDLATARAIVAAQGFASPDPETSPPWWETPQAKHRELSDEEREALAHGLAHVLSLADFVAPE